MTATEARDWGLVTRVVPAAELAAAARAQALAFAQGPTRTFGALKRLLAQSFATGLETQLEAETRGIVDSAQSEDGRTGVVAFLAKEKPAFRGR